MKTSNTEHETSYTSRIGTTVLEAVGVEQSAPYEEEAEWESPEEEDADDAGPSESDEEEIAASESDEPEELPLDQVFEILKNSRRREVLHYLDENDGSATLSNLAEHIAALENDTSIKAISSSQRKRVYVGLYQCHLPKMDDMGIVSFNKNRGTIELQDRAEQLEPYLETDDDQIRWPQYYLGISLGGSSLAGFSALGVLPALIPTTAIVTGFLALVAVCSVCHWYVESSTDS